MKVTAIVPAAGVGRRITKKKGRRKPFFIVASKPILLYTLLALERSRYIDDIILVVHRDDLARAHSLLKRFRIKGVKRIIAGGETRFDSVKRALAFVPESSRIVLIHDGVRPLIDKKILRETIMACRRFGAAVSGVPVVSTVKIVDKALMIKDTPERKRLYIAQTPQVFKKDIILKAYKRASKKSKAFTDDSMLVEMLGHKVKVIPGSYRNIKITTPEDLTLAETILRRRRAR